MTTPAWASPEPRMLVQSGSLQQDHDGQRRNSPRGHSNVKITEYHRSMVKRHLVMNPETLVEKALPGAHDGNTEEVDATSAVGGGRFRTIKPRRRLQLPSFQSLGICRPLPGTLPTPPDDISSSDLSASFSYSGDTPKSRSYSDGRPFLSPVSPRATRLPPMVTMSTPSPSSEPAVNVVTPEGYGSSTGSSGSQDQQGIHDEQTGSNYDSIVSTAVDMAVSNIRSNVSSNTPFTVNVLRWSQPCPLASSDETFTTAMEPLLSKLQSKLGPEESIDLTNAVPPQFEASHILSSPPTSPTWTASPTPGNDYFSLNIFPRIVLAPATPPNVSAPASPRPSVPPSSINISLLERYIPPSTANEYTDLFSPSGRPSVLVDRLYELSPHNGTLVFIYPTAKGGHDFLSEHLQPLLDPLLRGMIGVHGLSTDFGPSIANLAGAAGLSDFNVLKQKLVNLLSELSSPPPSVPDSPTAADTAISRRPTPFRHNAHTARPTLKLAHASTATIPLSTDTWMTSWTHQEKPRVRSTVEAYYRRGIRVPDERKITPVAFTWMILDGLKERAKAEERRKKERQKEKERKDGSDSEGQEQKGVEVGVFVVVRTS